MKRLLLFFLIIFSIFKLVILSGCANIVPPQGGFRDSLPPVLTKANPTDSSVNFTGKKISFTFDEYVTVENFSQNLLVSPIPKVTPTYISRLNTVTVTLKDTLEPNTTYTLNFGDAIKDVNEGNIMKNFSYVFSTGPKIDSLTFHGTVIDAEKGVADSTLTVMLHKTPADSAVISQRPRYVTKPDKNGNFVFKNLPPGTFYVYALKDDSRSYSYRDKGVLFAFADSPVVVQSNTTPTTLYAYAEKSKSNAATTTAGGKPNAADRRLKFQTNLDNNTQDLTKKFSFTFERPLRDFDSTKISFTTDTTYTPVTGYSWTKDSTRKKVTLNYTWPENKLFRMILQKDFATDTLGLQLLRPDTIKFNTLGSSDYGKLSIRFRNLDVSKNPVVQFVLNDQVAYSYPLTGENFSQPLFAPGEYGLRILYDRNKNGVWDPGEFFGKHIQPELVKAVNRKVVIKPNWENEFEIAL
jgi:Bacterial Ig-like domain